jgi:hypothetical protein
MKMYIDSDQKKIEFEVERLTKLMENLYFRRCKDGV